MTEEMHDYQVRWSFFAAKFPNAKDAAKYAAKQMTELAPGIHVFTATDEVGMSTTVDVDRDEVGFTTWIPDNAMLSDLAEWMHDDGWPMTEIVRMIRAPHKYASEYSRMISDKAFGSVAKEPEMEDLDDVTVC